MANQEVQRRIPVRRAGANEPRVTLEVLAHRVDAANSARAKEFRKRRICAEIRRHDEAEA
jgi:hypothetical protein